MGRLRSTARSQSRTASSVSGSALLWMTGRSRRGSFGAMSARCATPIDHARTLARCHNSGSRHPKPSESWHRIPTRRSGEKGCRWQRLQNSSQSRRDQRGRVCFFGMESSQFLLELVEGAATSLPTLASEFHRRVRWNNQIRHACPLTYQPELTASTWRCLTTLRERFVFVIFAIFCENDSLPPPCIIVGGCTPRDKNPTVNPLGQMTAAQKIAKIPKNHRRFGPLCGGPF